MHTILAAKPQGRESCRDVIVGVNVKLKCKIAGGLQHLYSNYCTVIRYNNIQTSRKITTYLYIIVSKYSAIFGNIYADLSYCVKHE